MSLDPTQRQDVRTGLVRTKANFALHPSFAARIAHRALMFPCDSKQNKKKGAAR